MIGSSLGFQAVRRRQRLKNVGSSACLSKNTAVFKDLSKAETLDKTLAAELAHLSATNLPPFDNTQGHTWGSQNLAKSKYELACKNDVQAVQGTFFSV